MVMSYSLAVVSNVVECGSNDNTCVKVKYKNFVDKVDYLMKNSIVVDSCHFTNEEMWVLVEMCDEYPKKRFGEANIYNSLILAKDDLVVFSTNEENPSLVGSQPMYGNPERLWNNIINIAIKMGAVDDLAEVVAAMRGVPYFLCEMNELTGENRFIMDFTPSYSITLGMEGLLNLPSTPRIVGKHCGYHASSKSLVADLQLGQMMLMSMFNVVEHLAAFGIFGVPSGSVRTDPFFDSNVRKYGLRCEAERDNTVLHEWKGFRGVPFFLTMMGNLKNVAVALAGEIRDGVYSHLRPQLLHALPFSRCHYATWGTIRGYNNPEFEFPKQEKVKAFAWVMGLTKKVPLVGFNAVGQLFSESLSDEELKLTVLADGAYDLCFTHKINSHVLQAIKFF